MARIRSVKPEFFTSEQIVECSPNARLLFIGLLCFSDDAGRHPASVKRLKMEVYPGDEFKLNTVNGWMDELIEQGLVAEYESQGQRYWWVTGWTRHQKVERPTVKYPDPFGEHSTIIRRTLALESSRMESNGVEPKGMEGSRMESSCSETGCADSEPNHEAGHFPLPPFPCVGNGPHEWSLTIAKLEEYQQSFPGIDVLAELRKARQWCIDHDRNRKTCSGMPRFLSGWLGRAQNSARASGQKPLPGMSEKESRTLENLTAWCAGTQEEMEP